MDGPKATIAKYGDDYFVTSYQRWLLFERACWLRGVENFLTDMIVDRPFAEWLLDRITEYQVEVARKYIEIGIDCGRTGDDWGSQMGMLFSLISGVVLSNHVLKKYGTFITMLVYLLFIIVVAIFVLLFQT